MATEAPYQALTIPDVIYHIIEQLHPKVKKLCPTTFNSFFKDYLSIALVCKQFYNIAEDPSVSISSKLPLKHTN